MPDSRECHCGSDCSCGEDQCSCGSNFHRRFQTKQEQIAGLEAYLKELKLETQSVEEILADLKK
jgi:hypothetical protein